MIRGGNAGPSRYIDLSKSTPLREGKRRLVFQHPDEPDLLIKVMKPGSYRQDGQPLKTKRLKLRRREGVFTYFTREMVEYLAVRVSSATDPAKLPISAVYGVTETDLGLGLLVEKVRGRDGRLAPTLDDLIAEGALTPTLRSQLTDFFDAMVEHQVVVYELNPDNIVLAEDEGASPRFVCIDGIGSRTLIPVKAWFKAANTYRLRKYQRAIETLVGRHALPDPR